jgi:hypothetical protein
MRHRRDGEFVGVGAGHLEVTQQGAGLRAEGVLNQGRVVQVGRSQHLEESLGLGLDATLASGLGEELVQLLEGAGARNCAHSP